MRGIACVCYASGSPETALAESLAAVRYYCLPIEGQFPKTLVSLRYRFSSVIDLTLGTVRQRLRLGAAAITGCDWRRELRRGMEAVTQAFGRGAFDAGIEALLVPSAEVGEGVNLIVFLET